MDSWCAQPGSIMAPSLMCQVLSSASQGLGFSVTMKIQQEWPAVCLMEREADLLSDVDDHTPSHVKDSSIQPITAHSGPSKCIPLSDP